MAARIRVLQVAIALVNLFIFALAFTSLWPFAAGDFKVDLPSAGEVEWSYDAGVVSVVAPYIITNGGFYDVADLAISYDVTNVTLDPVASDVLDIGTIAAGTVLDDALEFSIDLQDLYDRGLISMVFDYDYLNIVVEVSCKYTMKLVDFRAEYSVGVPWDPLIQDVTVDDVSYDAGTQQLVVDYHIVTSDLLSGVATMHASLYNGLLFISEDSETISLGGSDSGTLVFSVPLGDVPDRVLFEAQIDGFTFEQTYMIPSGVMP